MEQKRENFVLDDLDVEIALKHTRDFRHHFEIEYIGNNLGNVEAIKSYLRDVCKRFDIVPLDEDELDRKIREIKQKYGLN